MLRRLENKVEVDRIKQNVLKTKREDWITSEDGFLVLVDLAGYGGFCKFVKESQRTIFQDGDEIAELFRNGVAERFEKIVFKSKALQSSFTGDGFMAGIPDRLYPEDSTGGISDFISVYEQCIQYLEKINERLPEGVRKIGSRNVDYGPMHCLITSSTNPKSSY